MKGSQRRSASHVADRRCVDPDAAEALAGTNVIEAADLTQNAVNDVVEANIVGDTNGAVTFTWSAPPSTPRAGWWAAAPRWSGR